VASDVLYNVLFRKRPLDELLDGPGALPGINLLGDRDRALMRRIVATVLRRLGSLRHLLSQLLDRGLPRDAPRAETALLIGAAQIFWLDVPDHAAVDLSVRLAQGDHRAARYSGLVNAVLRRCVREGPRILQGTAAQGLDVPQWLMRRWISAYGEARAYAIIEAIGHEPPLDLTVKSNPRAWAARLHGEALPTGTVRVPLCGPVTLLPGFAEGEWWVQDAAAALPARLFGDVTGRAVADLCAAPGGKTAQLAHAGARVTAIDRSANRVARLRENLSRLGLFAETVVADVTQWNGGPFDGVLVDAPCMATGTLRRHPDIAWLKEESDLSALVAIQRALLAKAFDLVKPGGILVYCTCSLEPEEGEMMIAGFLTAESRAGRLPVTAAEVGGIAEFITPAGDLRTLPCHLPHADPNLGGLDGFYAARLRRTEA
jgi:16S rRNA (cytosine967-C5)-methyltransferase